MHKQVISLVRSAPYCNTVGMFVINADQRSSRTEADRVPQLLTAAADCAAALPFERTVGDEVQGVFASGADVLAALEIILRSGRWSVGIGIGAAQLADRPSASRGSAFIAARDAVEIAKNRWQEIAVCSPNGTVEPAQTLACLTGHWIERASERQWSVLRLARNHTQRQVAAQLQISQQAVSDSLRASKAAAIDEGMTQLEVLLDREDGRCDV